jgi:hypothetical protein
MALALSLSTAVGAAPRQHHATQIIPRFVGQVDAANVESFLDVLTAHDDRIVGLQVTFDGRKIDPPPANGYAAYEDGGLFVVDYGTLASPGIELVAPEAQAHLRHGSYLLDGFYIVKNSGMHQGTLSYALKRVDEGAVLASRKFRVVEQTIR